MNTTTKTKMHRSHKPLSLLSRIPSRSMANHLLSYDCLRDVLVWYCDGSVKISTSFQRDKSDALGKHQATITVISTQLSVCLATRRFQRRQRGEELMKKLRRCCERKNSC